MAMQQPPLSATSAQFAPTAFPGSPAQSPALTPHNIQFGSTTGPLTPGARSSTSQFSVAGSNAGDYKPAPEAQAFTPRKSAAIKIRNPKDLPTPTKPVVATPPVVDAAVKVEEKTAMPAVVPVVEKVDDSAAKKVEEDKKVAEDEKVAEEKKDAEEKRAAEEKIKVDAAAAAAAVAEEKSKVAAETKAKEESIAKEAAAAKEAVAAKEAAAAKDALAEEEAAAAKESDAAAAKEDVVTPALGENALAPVVEGVVTPTPVDSTPAPSSEKAVNGESTTVVDEAKAAADAALVAKSLAAAKPIENLNDVAYPAEIKSPRSDLNVSAEPGKYRYDREFLLQFMAVCQEKPEQLPNLESIGMLDAGSDANARPGFAGGRRAPSMGPPAVPNRAGGAPAAGFGSRNSSMGQFSGGMGNFGGGGAAAGMSSEDRFKASLAGGPRAGSAGGFPARAGGSMSRSSSQSGTIMAGANFVPSNQQGGRIRSGRGKPRDNERGGGGKPGQHVSGQGFEDAAPLEATANRWTPTVVGGAPAAGASDPDSPEMVQRKVKALLNKLTLEKFDSISGQILAWANKSENEVDGRILRQVIALIFEKATDEANWSEMYARLCRKLMEMVSTNVSDDSVKNADGTPVVGGALFRKYLLNRCQEDYESGWKLKEVAAAAAAATAADDNAKKEANDAAKESEEAAGAAGTSSSEPPKEAELLSDEYYAAQKAKRRGLGLVRFIGELYRLQMLTERIMHESIKKLLANTDTPEEEDVESLCRLLTTVGKVLDTPKAKGHLDIYCVRMNLIADNPKIASRIKFMIQVCSFSPSPFDLTHTSTCRMYSSCESNDGNLDTTPLDRNSFPRFIPTYVRFLAARDCVLTALHDTTGSASYGRQCATNGEFERKRNASIAGSALSTRIAERTRTGLRSASDRSRWLERTDAATTSESGRPLGVRKISRTVYHLPRWTVGSLRQGCESEGSCSTDDAVESVRFAEWCVRFAGRRRWTAEDSSRHGAEDRSRRWGGEGGGC